ncbi:MAG: hypothetical protein JNJ88_13330 [Planctomycetes bacterium]|nr:hypothetical protein [Planctomycetota bacterium]
MSADRNGLSESQDVRNCPTRGMVGAALIAHRITASECQKRQRELYHKCWTCVFANRFAGTPMRVAAEQAATAARNGEGSGNGHGSAHRNGVLHAHTNGTASSAAARDGVLVPVNTSSAPKLPKIKP